MADKIINDGKSSSLTPQLRLKCKSESIDIDESHPTPEFTQLKAQLALAGIGFQCVERGRNVELTLDFTKDPKAQAMVNTIDDAKRKTDITARKKAQDELDGMVSNHSLNYQRILDKFGIKDSLVAVELAARKSGGPKGTSILEVREILPLPQLPAQAAAVASGVAQKR